MADNPAWENKPKSPGYPAKPRFRGHDRARLTRLKKLLDGIAKRDVKNELKKVELGSYAKTPYVDPLDAAMAADFFGVADHVDYLLSLK